MTSSPKRSGRPGGISTIGLTGAPATAAPVAPPTTPPPPFPDVPTPPLAPVPSQKAAEVKARGEAVTSPRARFTAPPATADTTSSYTLRLHVDDAQEVDELRARLRKRTGRRALDQSEILRGLLRLAVDDEAVRAALINVLTTS